MSISDLIDSGAIEFQDFTPGSGDLSKLISALNNLYNNSSLARAYFDNITNYNPEHLSLIFASTNAPGALANESVVYVNSKRPVSPA